MAPQAAIGNVIHETSSKLQVIEVTNNGEDITKVLIDKTTRHAFPMDETQWRELEMFVIADMELKGHANFKPHSSD